MADLYLGVLIVLFAALLAGVGTYQLARRGWRWTVVALAVVSAAGLAFNVAYLRHSLWPARWLPFSNVMVLADPDPWLAAVLIGAGAALMPGTAARRSVLLVPLAIVCLWGSYGGYFLSLPPLEDRWTGPVCRQTSQATCGPAAAATLLAWYGVQSSEAEMAKLSMTTVDGTSTRGVYRGLKLKTRGTNLAVEPYFGKVDDLSKLGGPVLLFVRLDAKPGVDPRFEGKWGWKPGVAHVVVLYFCRRDGAYIMGDPATGPEYWDRNALETLWHGEGIRLVRKGT
jgi:hypothetical protein